MTKDEMISILETNKDLIESKNFTKLYSPFWFDRHYLTDLFLKSGINPLEYMEEVPEYYAYELKNLKNVEIPDNISAINYTAFAYCDNLKNVKIPKNVRSIGRNAFYDCRNLSSITVPKSLLWIGDEAFVGCEKLTDVYYEGSPEDWEQIDKGYHNVALTNAKIHYNSKI